VDSLKPFLINNNKNFDFPKQANSTLLVQRESALWYQSAFHYLKTP